MTHSSMLDTWQRLLVLGFGVTGRAVCEFAIRHSLSVAVSERRQLSREQQDWLLDNDIPFEHGEHTSRLLANVDVVVLSPGVPPGLPVVEEALQRGVAVLSAMDFALNLVGDRAVIAVTGTNGKSSTVEVIGTILRSLGKRTWVAGNIGIPLISIIDDVADSDILVLEISSYQLEQSRGFCPRVGVLLNLSPDHVDRHGNLQAYANAKGRLFANQEPDDVAVLPSTLAAQFERGKGRRVYYDRAFECLPFSVDILLPHELSNLRAALAACAALMPALDIAEIPIEDVCRAFRLPHRMERVGRVGNVQIINDSKSTNAGSAIAALRSIDSPVVLLLGGRSKGVGYESLVDEISTSDHIRQVVLFGEATDTLMRLFERDACVMPAPVCAQTMAAAAKQAVRLAQPGDVVLFSPACSSFDAFADYAERGDAFMALIRSLSAFEQRCSRT